MENYARLAMQEDEWYNNLSDESCAMPGTFAVFALGLEGPKWWRLVCDYLDRCDDEHSSLQEKFIHTFFKKYGFTAQSLPVLVHGVQSMQNLKPAKEFRTLIANEESLDALMEIKGIWNITCRKNPAMTKGRWPTCGVMCSGPSGAQPLKTAAARSSRRRPRN